MLRVFHLADDALRFHRHPRHARNEVDHLFFVIGEAIGVEFLADGRVFRRLFLVLIEYPFQRAAVANWRSTICCTSWPCLEIFLLDIFLH